MNGFLNHQTWNVALLINNDEPLYKLSTQCKDYKQFVSRVSYIYGQTATPDGVSYTDNELDTDHLDEVIRENATDH